MATAKSDFPKNECLFGSYVWVTLTAISVQQVKKQYL